MSYRRKMNGLAVAARGAGAGRVCFLSIALVMAAGCVASPAKPAAVEQAQSCVGDGRWVVPGQSQSVPRASVIDRLAGNDVVLLGEHHDNLMHHVWQLDVLSALYGRRDRLVIGLEMLPRSAQPALDAWIAGSLGEEEFLQQARWREYWKFDPALYWSIFRFARLNKIPMVALNADKDLVNAVRAQGWGNVPESARQGISDPAPPAEDYLDMLAATFAMHGGRASSEGGHGADIEATIAAARKDPAFQRFVQGQQLWDRAMAEALAGALRRFPGALVVGIMGSGHIMDRHGVPHQLAALGVSAAAVAVPWDAQFSCDMLTPGFADAVFGVTPVASDEQSRPKLGVQIEPSAEGVRVVKVVEGSVASAAGILADDIISQVAGHKAVSVEDVISNVQRTAPGTWLPVVVLRAGKTLELVAKFPAGST